MKSKRSLKKLGIEEYAKHLKEIKKFREDVKILERAHRMAQISKSQLKKSKADFYNKERQYMLDNNLEVFMGQLYRWIEFKPLEVREDVEWTGRLIPEASNETTV